MADHQGAIPHDLYGSASSSTTILESSSSSFSTWMTNPWVICLVVLGITYYYLYVWKQTNQGIIMTPEQQREARLARLGQQQQQQGQQQQQQQQQGQATTPTTIQKKAKKSIPSPLKGENSSALPAQAISQAQLKAQVPTNNNNQSTSATEVAKVESYLPQLQSNAKAKKAKISSLSPCELFCRAMEDATGFSIVLDTATPAVAATTKKDDPQTKMKKQKTIVLSDVSKDASIHDIKKLILESPNTFSLFQSLRSSILYNNNIKKKQTAPKSYIPIQLKDRKLAIASNWHQTIKTWVRDSKIKTGGDDDDSTSQQDLQSCLDLVADWIVATITTQLQADIAERGLDTLEKQMNRNQANYDDDDSDIDLGLFADESYGGDVTGAASYDSHLAEGHHQQATNDQKDAPHLLIDDVFLLLQSEACPKFLSSSFLSGIVQSYSERVGFAKDEDSDNNDHDALDNTKPSLGRILLQECLQRLPSPDSGVPLGDQNETSKPLTALTNLMVACPDAVKALARSNLPLVEEKYVPKNGRHQEDNSLLRPLLCLVAHTVPRFARNATATSSEGNNTNGQRRRRQPSDDLLPASFHNALVSSLKEEYPVCLYARSGYDSSRASYFAIVNHERNVMKHARNTATLALKKVHAISTSIDMRKGGALFDWIRHVVEANEPVVDILQSDLLSPSSAQAVCSSQPFLLGMAASLIQFCGPPLAGRLEKEGVRAFDAEYFLREEGSQNGTVGIAVVSKERRLIDARGGINGKLDNPNVSRKKYAGATEFFFLTAALLRVSVFPGFRIQDEFNQRYRDSMSMIRTLAEKQPSLDQLKQISVEPYQKIVSVMIGWSTFDEDPDINPALTSFSLIQLQWISMVVRDTDSSRRDAVLSLIPEWFVKLAAQWVAHVALYTPRFLLPHQGEAAVQYATQILAAGTSGQAGTSFRLSPPVLTSLIRIAGAFVSAGVKRARSREKAKHGKRKRPARHTSAGGATEEIEDDFDNDLIDDRVLDIYTSFDKNDLGVTVFTNEQVSKHLCPTLIRAYYALDAVEGMDVEREHHFDKFHVKSDVADLLLRLWSHPSGDCRRSVVEDLDKSTMSDFASSVAGALGLLLDGSCQNLLDIQDTHNAHEQRFRRMQVVPPLTGQDMMYCEHHARSAASGFMGTRRLLMLLCRLSSENDIAAVFGGSSAAKSENANQTAAADLAGMFLHSMDRLTNEDGGIHAELDSRRAYSDLRSATLLSTTSRDKLQSQNQQLEYLKGLIFARRLALVEYGLDVSSLAHQMLALAARWHLAAASKENNKERYSRFLDQVAKNDLCSINQLRNVLSRLVGCPREMAGSEAENANYILNRDGHVDIGIWKDLYKIPRSGPDKSRQRRHTAKQERMGYDEIDSMASKSDISMFLDDLEKAVARLEKAKVAATWGDDSMAKLETRMIGQGSVVSDGDYNELLDEWVVSSESFLSKFDNRTFVHSYDSNARARSQSIGSGKILVKEAKKAKRVLPSPHPNASIYVCFAEERMDLCKAIIIGTVDTPYSLGMFEFDILFPSSYPSAPPLLTFKTTGDGQTRVSPNLYNDGKVCISILGTANAWNDSQRWDPGNSSLAQVLASVQTQILGVPDPYFSEGFGHEGVRGTVGGEAGSTRYNNKLRLHTLRSAMIAPLKHPPLGFEEVTKRHFALCRKRILVQARRWTCEAQGTPLFRRFTRSYEELITLLSSDDLVLHRLPGQASDSEDEKAPLGAVPPNESDVHALEKLDSAFLERIGSAMGTRDTSIDRDQDAALQWGFNMEEDGSYDDEEFPGNDNQRNQGIVENIVDLVQAAEFLGDIRAAALENNPWAGGGGRAVVEQQDASSEEEENDNNRDQDEDEEDFYS